MPVYVPMMTMKFMYLPMKRRADWEEANQEEASQEEVKQGVHNNRYIMKEVSKKWKKKRIRSVASVTALEESTT